MYINKQQKTLFLIKEDEKKEAVWRKQESFTKPYREYLTKVKRLFLHNVYGWKVEDILTFVAANTCEES